MSAALFDRFASLHTPGRPLVLLNIWDPGSAKAVAEAGAPALATGSASVAMAHGFGDGEALPLAIALDNALRIVAAVDVPVTVDFEGGYAERPDDVAANLVRLQDTGAIGCNFEDQQVGGEGLHPIAAQSSRIQAARAALGASFFINARTDLFLKSKPDQHEGHVEEAIARGRAYADAGASGFFVPGLTDPGLIARIVEASPLPVNIMAMPGFAGDAASVAPLGVARISHGPFPYMAAMKALTREAAVHYG